MCCDGFRSNKSKREKQSVLERRVMIAHHVALSLEGQLVGELSGEPTKGKVTLRAGLHYGGEGLRSVKNAWQRHGYIRQMVDVPEKN